MNVLVLSHMFPNPSNPQSGIFVFEQLRSLSAMGISVYVISPVTWIPVGLRHIKKWKKYQDIPDKDIVGDIPVIHPRAIELPQGRLLAISGFSYHLACLKIVRFLMKEQRFDLIHAHTILPDGFAAILLGKQLNLPVICTIHGSDINIYPNRNILNLWTTKWALKKANVCIAVSQRLREKIIDYGGEDLSVEVVYNGADPSVFAPVPKREARRKLNIPIDGDILLYVGNLISVKGVDDLINVFDQVRKQRKQMRLYIVGEGERQNFLKEMVKNRGLGNNVVFVGRRPHSEIPLWLSAANCLVMPSLSEGFPTLLPEAMMIGIPIVGTNVGGIPEILIDSVTGILVPPGDVEALVTGINRLADEGLAERLAYQARQIALSKFTWESNARRMLEIYQSLIRHNRFVSDANSS